MLIQGTNHHSRYTRHTSPRTARTARVNLRMHSEAETHIPALFCALHDDEVTHFKPKRDVYQHQQLLETTEEDAIKQSMLVLMILWPRQ